jgi:hypothetical protein
MTDPFEQRLTELAGEVQFPPTPPGLAAAVRARVAPFAPPGPERRHTRRRALALALLLALLGAGVAAAAVPATRHAIGDLLGLRDATVRRVPSVAPVPPPAPEELGARVTLSEAARLAGSPVLLAHDARLGAPRAVRAIAAPGGARVTVVYGGGVTLTQVRGRTATDLVRKLTPRSTPVRRVLVRPGEPGIYVGGSHVVMYLDAAGQVVADSARRSGRVLLWERGPQLLRLEAGVSERRALAIARSVR